MTGENVNTAIISSDYVLIFNSVNYLIKDFVVFFINLFI